MTLANRITVGRLVLIPIFCALVLSYTGEEPYLRWLAIAAFAVAAVSDALDGFIARRYQQRTKLGAVLDPLADKLLINLAFVLLAVNDSFETPVPNWVAAIILGRDGIIVIGAYLINEYFGPLKIAPRVTGKVTAMLQMLSILGVLLELDFAYSLLMLTLAVSLISFFDYLIEGVRQVGEADVAE